VVAIVVAGVLSGPAPALAVPSPRAACQPNDRTETGLQGQVPVADRADGRAARGYNCNIALIGSYVEPGRITIAHDDSAAWATLDTYQDCAYYGDSSVGLTASAGAPDPRLVKGGVVVLDVSDPAHPRQTDYLTTPAMQAPWEALRVNARRGLLVADRNASHAFDVYDVASDCRHPKLLSSTEMPNAIGHEGYFAPDGRTFYMTDGGTGALGAIDLSDPRHPKQLGYWKFAGADGFHGGSVSDDGMTAYQCEYTRPGSVRILDVSAIQNRTSFAEPRTVAHAFVANDSTCQATYPVTYGGRPYLIQYGELSAVRCPDSYNDFLQGLGGDISNFNAPAIIDMADPAHPQVVGEMRTEVDEPQNCPLIQGDISPRSVGFAPGAGGGGALFGYDTHHCSPDRLHDPTILACGAFLSGLRVWDIRDPRRPRELAYDNMGTVSQADQTIDDAISRPVVRTDEGLVYWTTEFSGFHVGEFENGTWPFPGRQCGDRADYYFAQYNPGSACLAPTPHACASRRSFAVTLRGAVRATVFVDGRERGGARRVRGGRVRVDLRGRRAGRVMVRIVGRTRAGRRVMTVRVYRTCARRR
jgi:hypothetical protein